MSAQCRVVGPAGHLAARFGIVAMRDTRSIRSGCGCLSGGGCSGLRWGDKDLINRDALRADPVTAVPAGKIRAMHRSRAPVAGKSTPNRPESGVSSPSGDRNILHDGSVTADLPVRLFPKAREEASNQLVLDFDAADDPVHWSREVGFSTVIMTAPHRLIFAASVTFRRPGSCRGPFQGSRARR